MIKQFEWDPHKATTNVKKHGVSFNQAAFAFYDPRALFHVDHKHSTHDEEREICLGLTNEGILLVIFVERQKDQDMVFRIISARKANRQERGRYYEE